MKEIIKLITILCDGTVFIETNRRSYKRKLRKDINDNEYFLFKNNEYFIKNTMYDIVFDY